MRYVGIDPGLDGAIACITDDLAVVLCEDLPTLTRTIGKKKSRVLNAALLSLKLRELAWEPAEYACEVSQVARRLGNGRTPGATSTFSTGRTFGMIEGIAASQEIPMLWVQPQAWKKRLGLTGRGKEHSILQAVHLIPQSTKYLTCKKDDGRAEALLIAYYALTLARQPVTA